MTGVMKVRRVAGLAGRATRRTPVGDSAMPRRMHDTRLGNVGVTGVTGIAPSALGRAHRLSHLPPALGVTGVTRCDGPEVWR